MAKRSKAHGIAKLVGRAGLVRNDVVATFDSDQVVSIVGENASMAVYTTAAELPTSGLTAGNQAFISSTGRLYISNSNGWYNIALINQAPYWIEQPDGSYSLSTTGASTIITILAGDSDSTAPTYTVTADSDFNTIATITTDSEGADGTRFIITPIDSEGGTAVAGSGTVTFIATDGINQASAVSTFSLSFSLPEPDWAGNVTEYLYNRATLSLGQNGTYNGEDLSFSFDGNYLISGQNRESTSGSESGAAYIVKKNGASWANEATLKASDPQANAQFGRGVALNEDGTYAAVGAWAHDTNDGASGAAHGKVYIFTRSGSTWSQQASFVSQNDTEEFRFGWRVRLDATATRVFISSRYDSSNSGGYGEGAVYVYKRTGSSWAYEARLNASDGAAWHTFGYDIATNSAGDYLVATAPNVGSAAGAVYVFTRSGTTWSQQVKLQEPGGAISNNKFGASIDINNDASYMVVGADQAPYSGNNYGKIYVYTRSGTTWTNQAGFQPSSGATGGDYNGYHVRINDSGTHVAASAVGWENTNFTGRVIVYKRTGSSWAQAKVLSGSNTGTGDYFGEGLAMDASGRYVAVGAPRDDTDQGNVGTVSIFTAPDA